VDEAIQAYEQGLRSNTDNPDLLNNYAVALRQAGRPEEAIGTLEGALARLPDDPNVNLNLAIAYRAAQRWPEATARYEHWLQLVPVPSDPGPLFDLGYCYEQLGRQDDAVRIYTRYQGLVRSDEAATTRVDDRLHGLGH
jgi:tetratricopeptide (TPR) repeat protein